MSPKFVRTTVRREKSESELQRDLQYWSAWGGPFPSSYIDEEVLVRVHVPFFKRLFRSGTK